MSFKVLKNVSAAQSKIALEVHKIMFISIDLLQSLLSIILGKLSVPERRNS